MKGLAYLLIIASLVAGSLAVVTAYLPRLDALDLPGEAVTLGGPVGQNPGDPAQPLLSPDAADAPVVLTRERIARLRAAGVERVPVNEFALARWDHRYLFLAAVLGLLAGAWLVRRADRPYAAVLPGGAVAEEQMPEYNLRAAQAEVRRLREEVEAMADASEQSAAVTQRLDVVQERYLAPFVAARPVLMRRLGLAGYARVMDRFAAAERQLNRAWSAAADHVLGEALACLDGGAARLEEARALLMREADQPA